MQLSAQLTSALAGILLVVPMFFLGRQLFDGRVAFWGTLLFQCLPASGRLMADGLSEPLFLLLATSSLALAAHSLRTGSVLGLGLCGLFGGLAYLTRPEGALIPLMTGVVLVAMQALRPWRRPWGTFLLGGASLSAATLVVAVPFMLLIGGVTVKPAGHEIMGTPAYDAPTWKSPIPEGAGLTLGPLWAVWDPRPFGPNGEPPSRRFWALGALGVSLGKGLGHVLWAPALLALWAFRDRFRRVPGTWVLLLVSLALVALLYRVACFLGYMSERHLMLILLPVKLVLRESTQRG
jgi:4-amino-4-deoxy-L-arabinose transferase-like glycosyltransferase